MQFIETVLSHFFYYTISSAFMGKKMMEKGALFHVERKE